MKSIARTATLVRRASGRGHGLPPQVMDALSELLRTVQLQGAVFYNAEFSAPWSFRAPPSCSIAPYISSGAAHVILYHFLIEGAGAARLENGETIQLTAGDVIVFPHGDPHVLWNGPPIEPVDNSKQLEQIFKQGLTLARYGGGGEVTKFVCGYMTCDAQLCSAFLGGLPPMLKVNIRSDASGQWLENSIRFSVSEAGGDRAGGDVVVAKLSEVLFAETLRRYVHALPEEQTGWFAGARNPEIGRVLALMHREPARGWTIAALAEAAGLSRSVLAERFRHFIETTPMSYLTNWRLQLGARLLNGTNRSVAEIAAEVGYESEQAFNRAFKRLFKLPPARYRLFRKNQERNPGAAQTGLNRSSPRSGPRHAVV